MLRAVYPFDKMYVNACRFLEESRYIYILNQCVKVSAKVFHWVVNEKIVKMDQEQVILGDDRKTNIVIL